jgi:hypothetical protein
MYLFQHRQLEVLLVMCHPAGVFNPEPPPLDQSQHRHYLLSVLANLTITTGAKQLRSAHLVYI